MNFEGLMLDSVYLLFQVEVDILFDGFKKMGIKN